MHTEPIARSAITSLAALALASATVVAAGCTTSDDGTGPAIVTKPIWVDPIEEAVALSWTAEVDCIDSARSGCDADVPFTIDSVTCDGCELRNASDDSAFSPDATLYDEGVTLHGLPTTIGTATITAVLRRGYSDETVIVTTTAAGDRVTAMSAECWLAGSLDLADPATSACGTTRNSAAVLYVLPTATTSAHGTFELPTDGAPLNNGSPNFGQTEFIVHLPTVSPATSDWRWFDRPNGDGIGGLAAHIDSTTTAAAATLSWQLVHGDPVETTVPLPTLSN
jgi:hypothetical protein